jgi:hypothetical protein
VKIQGLLKLNKTPITLKWIFQIKTFPYCKDHSVSKEIFDLYHETTDMLITYPQPSLDNLGSIMKVKIIFRIQMVNDRYLKKHTIL